MSKTALAGVFAMLVAAVGEGLRAFGVYDLTNEEVTALNDGFGALLALGALVVTMETHKQATQIKAGAVSAPASPPTDPPPAAAPALTVVDAPSSSASVTDYKVTAAGLPSDAEELASPPPPTPTGFAPVSVAS